MNKPSFKRFITAICAFILFLPCVAVLFACNVKEESRVEYVGVSDKKIKVLSDIPVPSTVSVPVIAEGDFHGEIYNLFGIFFEDSINEDNRARLSGDCIKIFNELSALHFETAPVDIIVTDDVDMPFVQKDTVVINSNTDFTTVTQLIIQTKYDGWANYGLTFAFANHIAQLCNREYVHTDEAAAKVFLSEKENEQFLDFSAPCFSPTYTAEEKISSAKNASAVFWNYLTEKLDYTDIYKLFDDISLLHEYTDAWLKSLGISITYTLTDVKFRVPNYDAVAVAYFHDTVWYILKDYEDMLSAKGAYVSNITSNYADLLYHLENNGKLMDAADDIFAGYVDRENMVKPLHMIMSPETDWGLSGNIEGVAISKNLIYCRGLEAVLHEYIHYISYNGVSGRRYGPKTEILAYYYSRYIGFIYPIPNAFHYGIEYDKYMIMYNDEYEEDEMIEGFKTYLGRNIDLDTDYLLFCDYMTMFFDSFDMIKTYPTFEVAISFMTYMLNAYPDLDLRAELMRADGYIDGKIMSNYIPEWEASIRAKFE